MSSATVDSNWDQTSQYYSGQGEVLIGLRDANGNPAGLRPLGNCSDLKISIATTVINHKGSQDGQRAIDARLQTETNASISFTLDNWIAANLAKAVRGGATIIPAGTQSSESVLAYVGLVTGLQYVEVSAETLTVGSSLVPFVAVGTPWDYKLNKDAGSILINPGTADNFSTLGVTPSAITPGATTMLTLTNTAGLASTIVVGQQVAVQGVTGTGSAAANGLFTVSAASATAITINAITTALTLVVSSAKVVGVGNVITISAAYSYAAQTLVDSLTQPLTDNWLRFEGLNTVNTNLPVIVEVFRFQNDPLKEMALLSDTFGEFQLEGTVLRDGTRPSGSQYFRVKQLY